MQSIHEVRPVEGSRVRIYYYYGSDPQPYTEDVVWDEKYLHEYHVTHWENI